MPRSGWTPPPHRPSYFTFPTLPPANSVAPQMHFANCIYDAKEELGVFLHVIYLMEIPFLIWEKFCATCRAAAGPPPPSLLKKYSGR
jgi:hypothetical protein